MNGHYLLINIKVPIIKVRFSNVPNYKEYFKEYLNQKLFLKKWPLFILYIRIKLCPRLLC